MFPNRVSGLCTGPPTAPPHGKEDRAVKIAGKAKIAPSYKGVGVFASRNKQRRVM